MFFCTNIVFTPCLLYFLLVDFSVKRPKGRALAYTFLEISSKRSAIDHVDTCKALGLAT